MLWPAQHMEAMLLGKQELPVHRCGKQELPILALSPVDQTLDAACRLRCAMAASICAQPAVLQIRTLVVRTAGHSYQPTPPSQCQPQSWPLCTTTTGVYGQGMGDHGGSSLTTASALKP